MFLAPSAGNNLWIWIPQPQFFPRCHCQNSIALYLWRHCLRKKLILRANPSSCLLCMRSHWMITSFQMENHTYQRTVAHLDRLRLLTQIRESHQLSLLSQLVQAKVDKFALCHKKWLNPCPNKIYKATKLCTTWLPKLKWASWWRPLPWLPLSTTGADEKPYFLPCRNDGWHHVSSTSAQIARSKGICTSCHQGSQ